LPPCARLEQQGCPAENKPENWRNPIEREADRLQHEADSLRESAKSMHPARTRHARAAARRQAEIRASELESRREALLDRCNSCTAPEE
jgi:hypothetical protein